MAKALSGGEARKVVVRRQGSASPIDSYANSIAKADAEKSGEVKEKLVKSQKEADAHGSLQVVGKKIHEFDEEISASTLTSETATEAFSKASKPQPQQQQQVTGIATIAVTTSIASSQLTAKLNPIRENRRKRRGQ